MFSQPNKYDVVELHILLMITQVMFIGWRMLFEPKKRALITWTDILRIVCIGHLNVVRKILYSMRYRLPWFIYLEAADFELLGFKNADLAFDFHTGSALPSWCSNRQLFTVIYQREVSSI